jgi:hypothetical protein
MSSISYSVQTYRIVAGARHGTEGASGANHGSNPFPLARDAP